MQPKFVAGAENVVKTETCAKHSNDCSVLLLLGIYTPLCQRVLLTIIGSELPIDIKISSALLINILLGSFQLFLHSDQPLSEGEINPVQRCLPVGEAALSTPEAVVSHALINRLL